MLTTHGRSIDDFVQRVLTVEDFTAFEPIRHVISNLKLVLGIHVFSIQVQLFYPCEDSSAVHIYHI